jgi:RNase P subunit RPR2
MLCTLLGHAYELRSVAADMVTWKCRRCGHVKRRSPFTTGKRTR